MTTSEQKRLVGIAEWAVSQDAGQTLSTYALGSCLGVAMFDPLGRIGGLLHVMLPDSKLDPVRAVGKPAMFVDTAIPAFLKELAGHQADLRRLVVCVAGGAELMDAGSAFNIGQRNFEVLQAELQNQGLPIAAAQTGGRVNRSMFLRLATGSVRLKISGQREEIILCANSTST